MENNIAPVAPVQVPGKSSKRLGVAFLIFVIIFAIGVGTWIAIPLFDKKETVAIPVPVPSASEFTQMSSDLLSNDESRIQGVLSIDPSLISSAAAILIQIKGLTIDPSTFQQDSENEHLAIVKGTWTYVDDAKETNYIYLELKNGKWMIIDASILGYLIHPESAPLIPSTTP